MSGNNPKAETPEALRPEGIVYTGPEVGEKVRVDNWEHKSTGMRCKSCMWYVPKRPDPGKKPTGRCRRRAPTMNGYPVVFQLDWCGDHKLSD